MKPPRPKPHLVISRFSDPPPKSGVNLRALCMKKGQSVPRAEWVGTSEDLATVEDFFKQLGGRLCSECVKAYRKLPKTNHRLRIGAVISGQETRLDSIEGATE